MISKIFRSLAPVVIGFAILALLAPASLHAQTSSSLVANRLTQPIDESSLVTIKGTVHPLANRVNDRGAVPESMPLDRIQVVLKRSAAQESALQQLIHDEHTRGTANYHKWLTPAQFGQQFGPSDQDIATLQSWLASKGFNVEKVNPGKQTLEMSGNASQFQSAFHASIHKYMVDGQIHYANASDPQIPAALAPVFGGFVSLNNFHAHRLSVLLGEASYNTKTGQTKPQWTWGNSSGVAFVLAPSDFGVQYDLPTGLTGSGQTIAIINDSNVNIAQVNNFRTLFSLPANPPQVVIDGNDPGIDGINDPDGPNYDSVEAYLDVEWAGAVAPQATVDLVVAADTALETGVILAAERAVNSNLAPVMSVSFGFGCESSLGTSGNQFFNALWEQAAAQGITVMVSTGDSGSAGCDSDSQYFAVNGGGVSGLASTPYNVAVGGTDFFYSSYNQGSAAIDAQLATYWNTTATQSPATSIKSVIPEQPWNDSQYGLNLASVYVSSGGTETTISGGSGGSSTVYAKPTWQSGPGVPADGHRDLPDVSLFAANGLNYSFYPICAVDADCLAPTGTNLVQISGVGGTSASSPAFAGIMALVNQQYGRQGQADYVLYNLATNHPSIFHDVTQGTNSVPCAYSATPADNTPDCIAVTDPLTVTDPNLGEATEGQIGSGTTALFNAGAGYDQASGIGTVDAAQLINYWGSVSTSGTNVTLTSPTTATSVAHGAAVTVSGTVAGSGSSTPSGDVAIQTDSNDPGQQNQGFLTLSSGAFSSSLTTLPGGTYDIWANYGGDATNASGQSQKTQITVTPENSGIYLGVFDLLTGQGEGPAIAPGTGNIPYGTQLITSAEPAPSSQLTAFINCQTGASTTCPNFTTPTGTVVFSDNGSAVNTAVVNAEGDAEYNSAWSVGAHSITARYSGDGSYNPTTTISPNSPFTFTVVKNTPSINVYSAIATSSNALVGGQQNVITIQVQNSANLANEQALQGAIAVPAAPPTGSVSISISPSISGVPATATLAAGVDAQSAAPVGIATITLPASTAAGNYGFTISYAGDTNYATQTLSTTIPVQSVGGVATTTTAAISGSVSPTTTVTVSGTVTGKTGDAAPSNGGGGILIYAGGYILQQISVVPGTGDTSTFATTLNSQGLLQGSNTITVQYLGDNTYAPSAVTVTTTPIANPLSDFSMVPDTTIVPLSSGTPATDTIQLSPTNGFAGTVAFTCTAPAFITCSLSPTSYAFSGGASTATLNLSATNLAPNGLANVLITGVDSTGQFVHTLSIQANVSGASIAIPGFNLSASPSTLTLAPGATTGNTSNVLLVPSGGFTGSVALTAAVSGPSGATSPPTVSFSSGSVSITGQSTFSSAMTIATTSTTTAGTYTITVTGTSGATTSTGTVTLIISTAPPPTASFALSASPATIALAAGATSGNTSTITVTPANSFTGTVTFACAVTTAPAGANDPPTCVAPAASVTGSGNATSTLTVSTTAPMTTSALHNPLDKFFAAGGGLVVAGLLLFGIPARRRNWRSMLAILIFAGIVGLGIGCGSSGSSGITTPGTTAGSYVLTVTGTSGTLTETTTVNLTVN